VAEAEEVVERLEGDAGGLPEVAAPRDTADEVVQARERELLELGRGGRRGRSDGGAAGDAVDVDAAQAQGVAHAGLRGDRVQVGPHALEHRAVGLGVQVDEVERVVLEGGGVDHADLGLRVGVEVRPGLVEELARQGDPLAVDVLDDRQVRDVGRAVGGAGRQGRGDHALQAGADRLERHLEPAHSAAPARGPGVWS